MHKSAGPTADILSFPTKKTTNARGGDTNTLPDNLRTSESLIAFKRTIHNIMHQSIPAVPRFPGYCGAFACLVSPGGGAFANFMLPGHLPTLGPTPSSQHVRGFLSEYNCWAQLELTDALLCRVFFKDETNNMRIRSNFILSYFINFRV